MKTPPPPPSRDPQPPAAPAFPAPRPASASGSLFWKWFFSGAVRHALQMRKHVDKLLRAQRDLLSAQAAAALRQSMDELRAVCFTGDKAAIEAGMAELEKSANKWLRPYPNQGIRENVEVLLVAIAVAMAIRTFFLQPFKIPTGSMQPTLWGITSNPNFQNSGVAQDNLDPKPDFEIPSLLRRLGGFWASGVGYTHVVARGDGAVREVERRPARFLIFDLKQRFWLGNDPKPYTVWFPTDGLFQRAGLVTAGGDLNPRVFKKGEDIIKMRSVSGDHLFVDRMTYNFRRPQRGEIVVFETRHIQHINVPQDQFYIKRLVGLSDEKLRITRNRRLEVNGRELPPSTPHFENLYGYHPTYTPNEYFGHVGIENFANEAEFVAPPNHYVVMGDNTMSSLDSRYWGGVPREDFIGKAWFVYWPVSSRFGWGYR